MGMGSSIHNGYADSLKKYCEAKMGQPRSQPKLVCAVLLESFRRDAYNLYDRTVLVFRWHFHSIVFDPIHGDQILTSPRIE